MFRLVFKQDYSQVFRFAFCFSQLFLVLLPVVLPFLPNAPVSEALSGSGSSETSPTETCSLDADAEHQAQMKYYVDRLAVVVIFTLGALVGCDKDALAQLGVF